MQSEALQIGGCDLLVERLGHGPPLVVLHGEDGPRRAAPAARSGPKMRRSEASQAGSQPATARITMGRLKEQAMPCGTP